MTVHDQPIQQIATCSIEDNVPINCHIPVLVYDISKPDTQRCLDLEACRVMPKTDGSLDLVRVLAAGALILYSTLDL